MGRNESDAQPRSPVRVLIVDNHPPLRAAVHLACERRRGLEVVGEASQGGTAFEAFQELQPDVVVLDLQTPGLDARQAMQRMREQDPDVRVVVVSDRDDAAAVYDSLRLGGDGYLERHQSIGDVGNAIEAAAK